MELSRRAEIITEMQRVAPTGQQSLPADTVEQLRGLTAELAEAADDATDEFDRFVGVTERGLQLPVDEIEQHIAGKTIVVSGGTGCIGSTLLRELVAYQPAKIVSLSRGVSLPWQTTDGVEYRHADIRSAEDTSALLADVRPDMVYHLAAQHDPSLAEKEVNRTLATNILGTRNIIEASKAAGVEHLVYASTGKALRPFTPDTYAASKKAGEWLMSEAASDSDMLCSGVRFTHVVDNSIIFRRIANWIDNDQPIRLHGASILFYMQSARESAHLLLNAGLEARPDELTIEAIRDLEWPVNLTDLALGALIKRQAKTPIYFAGYEQGYEDMPYPGLYDPRYSGELSPLINAFEAPQASHSVASPQVDSFPLEIKTTPQLAASMAALEAVCLSNGSDDELRQASAALSWSMLDARLGSVPADVLARSNNKIVGRQDYEQLPAEHRRTAEAVGRALLTRP